MHESVYYARNSFEAITCQELFGLFNVHIHYIVWVMCDKQKGRKKMNKIAIFMPGFLKPD